MTTTTTSRNNSQRKKVSVPKTTTTLHPHKASTSTSTRDEKGDDDSETTTTPLLLHPQAPATTRRPVQCWAFNRSGRRCQTICKNREGEPIPIPYCHRHLKSGDYALKVVNHKLAGKCLVARFDLPKAYRMAYYGVRGKCPASDKEDRSISFYPPHPVTGSNCFPNTRTLKRHNYNGVLNPAGSGDILQYAACPGPTERQNIRSTFRYWGKRNGDLGGLEFVTLEPVPKNTMLCHWYGSGWWSARGIQRTDIGTVKYPAPKRPAYVNNTDENL
jgi:hypothetical protein